MLSTYPLGPAAPLVSGGDSYPAIPMVNSFVAIATAPLVSGGLCNTPLPAGDTQLVGQGRAVPAWRAAFLVKSQNVAGGGGLAAVIYNNVAGRSRRHVGH